MSAPLQKKSETWLIDENSCALYRKISDSKEQVIPIQSNKDMRKFICIPTERYLEIFYKLNGSEE